MNCIRWCVYACEISREVVTACIFEVILGGMPWCCRLGRPKIKMTFHVEFVLISTRPGPPPTDRLVSVNNPNQM